MSPPVLFRRGEPARRMERRLDFLIIGAQKAGTTTLFDQLSMHPDVFLPEAKEIAYFVQDEFWSQGDTYLDTAFGALDEEQLVGMAHVHMLYFPRCAARVRAYNPTARVLVCLRNPIDRAYSAYWFARRNGHEHARTFEEGLALEPPRVGGSHQEQAELTYVRHGEYMDQLQVYLDALGPDRVRVCLLDDLRDDPDQELADVLDWLGLPPAAIDTSRRSNSSTQARSRLVSRMVFRDSPLKKLVRSHTDARLRYWVQTRVLRPIVDWNVEPFRYPPMSRTTRARLARHFEPHNRRLQDFLGRDLSHWE